MVIAAVFCYAMAVKDVENRNYKSYYKATEELLDSINSEKPFADGVSETDAYVKYLKTRNNINNFNN